MSAEKDRNHFIYIRNRSVVSLHASSLSSVLLPRMLWLQGDCRSCVDLPEASCCNNCSWLSCPLYVCLYSAWHSVCVTWGPDIVMNTKQPLRSTLRIRGQLRLTPVSFRKWVEMWSVCSKNSLLSCRETNDSCSFSLMELVQDIKKKSSRLNRVNERSWSGCKEKCWHDLKFQFKHWIMLTCLEVEKHWAKYFAVKGAKFNKSTERSWSDNLSRNTESLSYR